LSEDNERNKEKSFHSWEDNIKVDVKEIVGGIVDWLRIGSK
jgi:hypothetical protein